MDEEEEEEERIIVTISKNPYVSIWTNLMIDFNWNPKRYYRLKRQSDNPPEIIAAMADIERRQRELCSNK